MTFKVKDGISIAGSLFVDGNRNISAANITAATVTATSAVFTSTQQSSNTQSGAVIVTGGVGVGGNLYATALYDNGVRVLTTASLGASGVASIAAGTDTRVSSSVGNVVVWDESTLQSVTGRGATSNVALTLSNTTAASSTNSGALQIVGGVGIGGNLYVGGEIVAQKLTIQLTTVTTTQVTTDDIISTYNTTQSTSTNSGALQVAGGAGIGKDLYVGGAIYRNGTPVGYGYTGSLGYTGSQGFTGSQGYTGSAGYNGSMGYWGSVGYTGSKGIDGFSGSVGYYGSVGYTGSKGIDGFSGSVGYYGSVGYTGSKGIDGFSGSAGFWGSVGYTGSKGFDGSHGYNGSAGYNGSVGYTGSAGYNGSVGYTGSAGYNGSVGYTGSAGYNGSVGYTGSAGFNGSVGYTGSAGYNGSVGYTGSMGYWGSVGYTGSAGYNGSMGYWGSVGYAGSMGYYGSAGYWGSVGYTGSLGYAGSAGPSNIINAITTASGTFYPVMVGATGNNQIAYADTGIYFDAAANALYVLGDFYVNGQQTIVNSTSIQTGDKTISLSTSSASAAVSASSGIQVGTYATPYASFLFDGVSNWVVGGSAATGLKATNVTASGLTAGRVVYPGTGGILSGSANFFFDAANNNLTINDTGIQYSAKLYVNGSVASRNGGVDGTFADAFLAGYTGNYNEKNIIQTAVSSGGTGSGFRFKVSDGGGLATTTTALDLTRSQILLYTAGTERVRVDASGNVGIGTTSPSGAAGLALAINGGANQTRIALKNTTTGDAVGDGFQIVLDAGGLDVGLEQREIGAIRISTSNTERARIDSNGNLLVGYTGAQTNGLLQVAGGIGIAANSTVRQATNADGGTLKFYGTQFVSAATNGGSYSYAGSGQIASVAAGASAVLLDVGGQGTGNSHRLKVVNDGTGITGYLYYGQEGGSTATLYANVATGYVGIGTTSPAQKLTISGSSGDTRILLTDSTAASNLFIGVNSSTIDINGVNGYPMVLYTANTERLRLTTNGGIAFGGAANYGTSGQYLKSNGDAAPTWSNVTASSADTILLTNVTSGATPRYLTHVSTTTGYTSLSGSAITGLVYIPSTGHLGIGTQAPADTAFFGGKAVDVYGPVYARQNGNSAYYTAIGTSGGLSILSAAGTSAQQLFYTAGTEKMRIDSAGNLNIGQSAGALQSGGTGITLYGTLYSEIKFVNGTVGTASTDGTALVANGNDFVINNREAGAVTLGTSNAERVRIDSSGNVGIGITGPTTLVHINDASTNRFAVRVQSTASNTANAYTGIGFSGEAANTKGGIFFQSLGSSYSRGNLVFSLNNALDQTDATPSTAVMTLRPSGGVAFGTSASAYGTSGYILKSNGDAAPTWIDPSTLSTNAATVTVTNDNATATAQYLTFVGASSGANAIKVSATSGITYIPSSGYLGLGVGTPLARLHVVGTESRFGGVASGYISVYDNSGRVGYIQANGGTDLRIAAEGATTPMTFYVNGSERVRIDTGGKLLVGSSTNSTTGMASQTPVMYVAGGYTNLNGLRVSGADPGNTLYLAQGTDFNLTNGSAFGLGLGTNGTQRIYINSAGQVGVGTASNTTYTLQVNGSFAASTKSFVIEHPTKPGYDLRYGSLEGPENGVYVRGRLKGNKIELPEYWSKLVDPDSITVDLTPVGKYQKLYVADISNNTITVANDGFFNKAVDCFYTVWAERADVEKLVVEIQKP